MKFVFASVIGVVAAALFGYLGAAAISTGLGQSLSAAVGLLLVLMAVVQGAMIAKSRRASWRRV